MRSLGRSDNLRRKRLDFCLILYLISDKMERIGEWRSVKYDGRWFMQENRPIYVLKYRERVGVRLLEKRGARPLGEKRGDCRNSKV